MATTGTIQGTTKNSSGVNITDKYGTWITWKRNSYSIPNNTSNITVTVYVQRVDSYSGETAWDLEYKPPVTLKVGGVAKSPTIYYIDTRNHKLCTIATWTGDVVHNADGTLTLALSCGWTLGASYLYSGSISGNATLDTIPRYPTVSHSEKSKTETTITMNWSSDSTIDYVWYSTDWGTTWIDVGTVNAKSGTYTINKPSNGGNALAPNTTYNIITCLRRKDSQLYKNSEKLSVTTYDYPYCLTTPDFTIGDNLTLTFYNPLGRTFKFYLIANDIQIDAEWTISNTSYTGVSAEGTQALLYKTIPNQQSATYKIKTVWGNYTWTTSNGNKFKIRGTEIPTINGFDYIDNNASTVAITGDATQIVQNHSILLARFHSATAIKGAGGISQYYLECNGKKANGNKEGAYNLGTIDSSRDVDLKLTVVDSRGLSASKTIKVKMLAHSTPTANVTLERLNNYEDETYLTVDGSISSVNGKNTMTIQYRYKVSGGTYNNFVTIGDRVKQTLSLDKNNAYSFNVVITDAFGSTFTGEYLLNKGVFPLFIDTALNSVGINCFPTEENSLEVNELNVFKVADAINKSRKQVLLGDDKGLIIEVKSFGGTDKIPIIVAGADNSSMTPVFTIIHMRSGSGFGYKSLGLDSTITRDGNRLHINSSQWSYFTVTAPIGCEISIYNGTL